MTHLRRVVPITAVMTLLLSMLVGCAAGGAARENASIHSSSTPSGTERYQTGTASWYGGKFHGRKTASGETYNKWDMTAAHRTLPLGTRVLVEHRRTGRRVNVRINDRGPFVDDRIIDLSRAAASELGMIDEGTAPVNLYRLKPGPGQGTDPSAAETRGHLTVQVGSFENAENARRLRTNLSPHFDTVYLTREGPHHRVRVGRFDDRGEVQDAARRLEEMGYDTWIVRESD